MEFAQVTLDSAHPNWADITFSAVLLPGSVKYVSQPMNFLASGLKKYELFPFPIIKSDTKLCHFFLLYIFPSSSLLSFYAPISEVQLTSPLDDCKGDSWPLWL